jgi:hypothetical protein
MNSKENQEIKKLRTLLFPAIGLQIITGFNMYPKKDVSDCFEGKNIEISYLHEDILEGKLHYIGIKQMLEKYCDQIKTQRIEHEAITRFSSYRLEESWEAEEYFLIDQTPVKLENIEDLIKQNITIIGCGMQNELIIRCEKDIMYYILEQFRLYANKYEISSETGKIILTPETGRIKLNQNETWHGAWEIPTIIVRAPRFNKIKTYEKVKKISFNVENEDVSLIIGNKWDERYINEEDRNLAIPSFQDYSVFKGFNAQKIDDNYFANEIFFDWLNEIKWERVKKTLELYTNLF